ncbi:hypothetical protein HanXRQr2_Chr14g0631781 [Helianthus annuus]|uniref:Uncharacterized protein n=1 Tax=Helianthus annuus TaxID=4232 RepID=A0A9K3E6Z0_HELAN|nr:hypothetical protein HanXRQr2_Chr14g0631781 [Helianthus annuus]
MGAEGERVQEHAEDEAGVHDRAGRYCFTFFFNRFRGSSGWTEVGGN